MKQLTHIKNKTYIIKQRGRFSKEYLDKMQRFMQYYRKNPSKFMEDFYGLKLPFWQRLMIEILWKFNKFRRDNEANKCVCEKCGGICQENDLYGDINPVYLCENCFTKTWQGEDKIEY